MLRLPDGMRDRVKEAAAANNRSMNAEIVATLEEKYPAPQPDMDMNEYMRSLSEKYSALETEEAKRAFLRKENQKLQDHPLFSGPTRIDSVAQKDGGLKIKLSVAPVTIYGSGNAIAGSPTASGDDHPRNKARKSPPQK